MKSILSKIILTKLWLIRIFLLRNAKLYDIITAWTFMTVYDCLWTFFVNDFDKEHSGLIADDLERSKLEA